MPNIPTSVDDILRSPTRRGLPHPVDYGKAGTSDYVQALDNFHRVFGIRPGDKVLMLTDPLLDPRVLNAVQGLCKSRGATFTSYMGESTRYLAVPDKVRPLVEEATFVVSTWFASVFDPFCQNLRRKHGQRWVKITFFRNLDLLHSEQARFPTELVGELVRQTAARIPRGLDYDLIFTDRRGSDLTIPITAKMNDRNLDTNRWRGEMFVTEPPAFDDILAEIAMFQSTFNSG